MTNLEAPLTIIAGIDVGNNATKAVVEGMDPFMFPTWINTVTQANIWESELDPMEHIDLEIIESRSGYTGRAFYGHLATRTRGTPMPVHSNKARSPQVIRTMICALALAAAKKLEAMRPRERKALRDANGRIPVTVHLGAGLPMNTWLDNDDLKAFRRAIRGRHVVRFVTTPKWSDYGELEITVGEMIVAAEGTAVLYGLVFDSQGRITDKALGKGVVLINDLGDNTHDAPVYRAMKQDNTLSASYDSEIARELQELADQIRITYGRTLNRHQLAEALFKHDMTLPNGVLERISIRPLAEPRFKNLADLYAARIIDCLERSGHELQHVIMAGGGAALVRPYLEEALKNRGLERLPFVLHWPEQAQFANAIGYIKLIQDRVAAKAKEQVG